MAQATRDPELQDCVNTFTRRATDLIEPASGDRRIAATAATVVLGFILTTVAQGRDHDPDSLRADVITIVQRFDPRQPR